MHTKTIIDIGNSWLVNEFTYIKNNDTERKSKTPQCRKVCCGE